MTLRTLERERRARWTRPALLAGFLAAAAGCGGLVETTPRDEIDPGALGTADGARALYNGALNAMALAFSGDGGGTEGFVLMGGTMADEFVHSGTFDTRQLYDRRNDNAQNGTVGTVWRRMSTARVAAARAHDALVATGSDPAVDARVGEMRALEALGYLLVGETFCNGAPFSTVQGATITDAPPMTNAEALELAVERLDDALAGAAGTGNYVHSFARILKARALTQLNRSNLPQAAALVAGVPPGFRYRVHHSINGARNGIYAFINEAERFAVAHREGGNGLPFRGAGDGTDPGQADPRVPWKRDAGDVGFDNATPQYDLLIYTSFDDDAVVASHTEARLIVAESMLEAGDVGGWLGGLNALRATVPGLTPLTDPGTTAARQNLHFSERAFWLFATGHRFGDLRRLVRQYGRDPESVFPSGIYFKNGVYGRDVNFPIGVLELNNALYAAAYQEGRLNVRGCLDNDA